MTMLHVRDLSWHFQALQKHFAVSCLGVTHTTALSLPPPNKDSLQLCRLLICACPLCKHMALQLALPCVV